MQVFLTLAYIVIGFIQLFAIASGVQFATELPGLLAFIVAAFLTYIPIVGSLAGIYGAVNAWDWTILQAAGLFFWYIPVMLIVLAFGAFADRRG